MHVTVAEGRILILFLTPVHLFIHVSIKLPLRFFVLTIVEGLRWRVVDARGVTKPVVVIHPAQFLWTG